MSPPPAPTPAPTPAPQSSPSISSPLPLPPPSNNNNTTTKHPIPIPTPIPYSELHKLHPELPPQPHQPTRTAECNSMTYTPGSGSGSSGVQRQIWLPKGTMRTACKHLQDENWAALEKYPDYVNQGYADEGEAEEEERNAWAWLVDETLETKAAALGAAETK
ncbi:hypothetical protein ONS95_012871 [Cadophora gregata]|uniref:uncharacterized protein n=1 Tax=Cadophora gregata TaxID=51156 RepID=UPI0026DCC683|nr:uncharacterized protein ONS95_012871 [Cadophora gregata]KAK0101148.1 hypothetical protein ONS96_006372 [Cadophora gregata f. sp. sojae]KAK0115820.1 hypothetical protein ONS95_012871 [Cadophora gregata]